ncbi:MAG: ATP-binding protein [Steroidobacteraceae bacterium]
MIALLRRLFPAGLRGQVAGILLLGLLLSQALAAVLYIVLLPHWQKVLRPELAVTKVAMVVHLLESVPEDERPRFAALWSDAGFRVRYAGPGDTANRRADLPGTPDQDLRTQIESALHGSDDTVRVQSTFRGNSADWKLIGVRLRGGGSLEVMTPVGLESRLGYLEQWAIVAFMVFAMAGLWGWLTWTVNHPLIAFARAAERVGVDVNAPILPEQGPAQLKRVIRAFNEMQSRLQRFLSDRTRMLGAISHDLRTPLTRLRLRIETDRAAEEKSKVLGDIEIMESMLTSTLSFIRGVDDVEAAEVVDLDSLLQTVCDLVSDTGGEVSYVGPGRSRYYCKPQSMMRALTNIVANAAKYGAHAVVSLSREEFGGFKIRITDDGPGIPDAEKAKVFEPFYRTALARDTDRQGMGLGLSIARSIILAHGGTIELRDGMPCGLIVTVNLPVAADASHH